MTDRAIGDPTGAREDEERLRTIERAEGIDDPYEHWNEEADRVRYQENRDAWELNSPFADMSDDEIKQAVYDRDEDDWPEEGEE